MRTFPDKPSDMSQPNFVAAFGRVYEHSPWIAEAVWEQGATAEHDSVEGLAKAMAAAVGEAPRARQLALIQAHPDLAGRAAVAGTLTAESTSEQSSAGLDRCSPAEYAEFQRLNAAYKDRFGFPFIIAVRGLGRAEILAAFQRRLENGAEEEFQTALAEIHKIARLRLEAMAEAGSSGI